MKRRMEWSMRQGRIAEDLAWVTSLGNSGVNSIINNKQHPEYKRLARIGYVVHEAQEKGVDLKKIIQFVCYKYEGTTDGSRHCEMLFTR